MIDPQIRTDSPTGGDVEIKGIWRQVDGQRWVFEMVERTYGREAKMVEMSATRP